MNTKTFGINWPGRFESMEQTLLGGEGDDYNRDDIFDFIQRFAEGSYWVGFDPIPHLQKVFPSLDWEYYELPDTDEKTKVAMLEEVVRNSDFFWPVAGPANPEDWLIARKRGEQKRLSFCGCAELLEDIKDFKSKNCPRLDKMPKAMRVLWSIYSKVPAVFGKVINGHPDL